MAMRNTKITLYTVFTLLLLLCAAPIPAQKHPQQKVTTNTSGLPEVIWHDAGSVPSLNLFYGAGGKEHAPDPNGTYKFLEEDMAETSPKFDVEDAQGVRWKVKLGTEPQSETAAARLMWAAGYFVDEDYYLAELKVSGLPQLRRGQNYVSAGGVVHGARLKRHLKGVKKIGNWDWIQNPFAGTRELNGLRVMMALLNNWDLHGYNNEVRDTDKERIYLVKDLGATFGKGGNNFTWTKSVLRDYENSKFIDKETPESVDFVTHSNIFFISMFNFGKRNKAESVTAKIPRADARWLAQRLSQLSDAQIRDSFRAAGYTPAEIDGFTSVVKKRIAALKAL